ncbi:MULTISPECIES: fumarylacetoacetate hydrolase family protein [Myroides]|uniref:2-hydroxyhepta-2,4-diene-1,7-dioate isomerase n=1 Tax=Myroides albus TaxID=2562892 RepID=A0A6I3LQ99_9FLAO|nr:MULTISPECIES: fumarylacetoacetate hydrolase family protein [Myroides]MTG98841.1 2-hydroxyhepta-2,4-diene-1,7-dioate isomerase [Myroides albus]MVX34512.1 2-hydroxyhepta-2,4-diene-1,7-dioate isomerase [Myroides sp. LoEW2-1]
MKILCIGRNYVDHIEELNNERPAEPVLFIKPDSALLGKEVPFVIPEFSNDVHYEVEVVVKITKVGKYIEPKFASKYYDEVTLGIDFTARDVQSRLKEKGLPWEKAKSFDGAAAVGEFFDKSELSNLYDSVFTLEQNNNIVQKASTSQMIWNIDEVIAEVSKYFTLKKGDLIFTGTPAGVGKVFEGDVLEATIEGKKVLRLNVK